MWKGFPNPRVEMKVFIAIELEFKLEPGKQVVKTVLYVVQITAEVDMEFHD